MGEAGARTFLSLSLSESDSSPRLLPCFFSFLAFFSRFSPPLESLDANAAGATGEGEGDGEAEEEEGENRSFTMICGDDCCLRILAAGRQVVVCVRAVSAARACARVPVCLCECVRV